MDFEKGIAWFLRFRKGKEGRSTEKSIVETGAEYVTEYMIVPYLTLGLKILDVTNGRD